MLGRMSRREHEARTVAQMTALYSRPSRGLCPWIHAAPIVHRESKGRIFILRILLSADEV